MKSLPFNKPWHCGKAQTCPSMFLTQLTHKNNCWKLHWMGKMNMRVWDGKVKPVGPPLKLDQERKSQKESIDEDIPPPFQQGGVKEKVRLRIKLCKTSASHAKMRAQSPFNDSTVIKKQEILKKNPTGKVILVREELGRILSSKNVLLFEGRIWGKPWS